MKADALLLRFWKPILQVGLLLSLWIGIDARLSAQIRFETGTDGTLRGATVGTWYYNTQSGKLSLLRDNGWRLMSGIWGFDRMVLCDRLVLVEEMHLTYIYNVHGDLLSVLLAKDMLPDSVLQGSRHISQYSKNGLGGISQPVTIAKCKTCAAYNLPRLRGKDVLCVPQYVDGILKGGVHQNEARKNWGMLSTDGEWLIEPIYDAPFVFQDGIAEVIYYGEKRKINEQGEFVE